MLNGLQKAKPTPSAGSGTPRLELLAHYELRESPSQNARSGFAVILELTERRLVIESDVALASQQELEVRFFLPDPENGGRLNVALKCVVAQCRDATRLHYSARISKISEAARAAIQRFQDAGDSR